MIRFLVSLAPVLLTPFTDPPEAPQVAAIHGQTFQPDLEPEPMLISEWRRWNLRTGEQEYNGIYSVTTTSLPNTTYAALSYPEFVTSCGAKGSISISLRDGSVKYDGMKPDEAGLAFWAAVTTAFPYVSEIIRHSRDGQPWRSEP